MDKSKKYGELVYELYRPVVRKQSADSSLQSKFLVLNSKKSQVSHFPIREIIEKAITTRSRPQKTQQNRIKRKPSLEHTKKKDKSFDYLASQRKLRKENRKA